jgi:hypothetical protein
MRYVDYVQQVVGVVSLWPDRSAGRALYALLVVLRERVANRTEIARGGTPCAASSCVPSILARKRRETLLSPVELRKAAEKRTVSAEFTVGLTTMASSR